MIWIIHLYVFSVYLFTLPVDIAQVIITITHCLQYINAQNITFLLQVTSSQQLSLVYLLLLCLDAYFIIVMA